jgi:hypothetical protein
MSPTNNKDAEINAHFKFHSVENVAFVAVQLQTFLKRFHHLDPMVALNHIIKKKEFNVDNVCSHYKNYVMAIQSLIFQANKLVYNDTSIFYDMLTDEYFKPRQLFMCDTDDESYNEHIRILDFVIYKFIMVEPIIDLIKDKDMGTAIMYKFMDDKLNMERVFTSIDRHDDDYDDIHDQTYEFLNTKTYHECVSFYDKQIEDKLEVYAIEPYERTIDFDEHHERTADMVQKPDNNTPKTLKRQRT